MPQVMECLGLMHALPAMPTHSLTPRSLQDLRRCAMDSASAVFIFANKFAANTDGEDSRTILRALSIKRYPVVPLPASIAPRVLPRGDSCPWLEKSLHGIPHNIQTI